MLSPWLIIDGNNLLHAARASASASSWPGGFDRARHHLARRLEQELGRIAGRDEAIQAPGMDVLYTSAATTADAMIERLCSRAAAPGQMTVITSDNAIRRIAESNGVHTLSCDSFLAALADEGTRRLQAPQPRHPPRPRSGLTLGDLFPPPPGRPTGPR